MTLHDISFDVMVSFIYSVPLLHVNALLLQFYRLHKTLIGQRRQDKIVKDCFEVICGAPTTLQDNGIGKTRLDQIFFVNVLIEPNVNISHELIFGCFSPTLGQ